MDAQCQTNAHACATHICRAQHLPAAAIFLRSACQLCMTGSCKCTAQDSEQTEALPCRCWRRRLTSGSTAAGPHCRQAMCRLQQPRTPAGTQRDSLALSSRICPAQQQALRNGTGSLQWRHRSSHCAACGMRPGQAPQAQGAEAHTPVAAITLQLAEDACGCACMRPARTGNVHESRKRGHSCSAMLAGGTLAQAAAPPGALRSVQTQQARPVSWPRKWPGLSSKQAMVVPG